MKDVEKIYVECCNELRTIGIDPPPVQKVTVNKRATTRWGQARRKSGVLSINISDVLLQDNVDDFPVRNTMMHEILHTCDMRDNHGSHWQSMAHKVNRELGYKISRCSNYSDYGIEPKEVEAKYILKCNNCGLEYKRSKKTKAIQNYQNYQCGKCKGSLSLIKGSI